MNNKYKIAICDSAQMMEYIQTNVIDVVFLDIDMSVFSGMDIAAFLNEKHPNTILIFVTSHDALVYQSFQYHPFGFVRKTYLREELQDVLERIATELCKRKRDIVVIKGGI